MNRPLINFVPFYKAFDVKPSEKIISLSLVALRFGIGDYK